MRQGGGFVYPPRIFTRCLEDVVERDRLKESVISIRGNSVHSFRVQVADKGTSSRATVAYRSESQFNFPRSPSRRSATAKRHALNIVHHACRRALIHRRDVGHKCVSQDATLDRDISDTLNIIGAAVDTFLLCSYHEAGKY